VRDEQALPAIELDGEPPQVDHIRHLALRLRSEMERREARSVLVTSALRDEGKTTVSCRLAIALASVSSGRGIALIDLDMRNPSVCKRLGFRPPHGISEAILGEIPLEAACHPFKEPRLDVYPSGQHRPAAHEILASEGFARVLDALHARYEFVVIDSPPTLLVPDSSLILRHADCCVTVAHAGITRVRLFRKLLDLLPAERIVGKILNGARTEKHERAYYRYGYGVEAESDPARQEGGA
jgi:capsular exopolysaccharide synthesis family protein